ncbi:MAG: acetyl-CoA carboxylase biotin carboxylase subunit [Candidatus Aminicenantes bacterium]|nr:acetyl-CoA carboxylase biotin carboxylase subunit [Candidatus Aminicenantes bacterium]
MFLKILVANRGEIALRIIRSAKLLGIKTVAVYSEPDKNSLHVMLADEKICIGPSKSTDSYLNIPNVLSAADITKADAIHPGYGFLAESPRFADICETHGITFIGPPASIMKIMADKNNARQEMKKARLPIIPGSDKILSNTEEAKKEAQKIGYPVILKAAAGGGGKGMRIVRTSGQLEGQFAIAQGEAKAAFDNSDLYMEKFIQGAHHIEIQVIADLKGNIMALTERECSIQRKYQKVLEETPSPYIDEKLRKKMIKAVEEAARTIGYQSLGTFEFLVDDKKQFYFMEANTRVQVEHPITEFIYDIDLIKEQIKIAAGEKLSLKNDMKISGHSIECRINAEDAETFIPSPGKIDFLTLPGGEGIRVDTAAYSGWEIPPFYDSLLAKIIAKGPNRKEAVDKIRTALEMTTVVGVKTNIPLHLAILSNNDFKKGNYDIQFLTKFLKSAGRR